ncbi:MAG TPA: hypothetical protein PKM21_08480 [Anaerolineales bacterium]|nr:hypothetical protein [Anaerolineales bacterium]
MELLTQYADLIGAVVGFVLTLMVLSYLVGDNFLFRIAIHIFIGVAAGYAVAMLLYHVLWYRLIVPLLQDPIQNLWLGVPGLLLLIWMFAKASPRLARLGNPLLAYLAGVGAATAIGGAIVGTIFPQVGASINLLDLQAARQSGSVLSSTLLKGLTILVGTLATLGYFHFGVRPVAGSASSQRPAFIENVVAPVGHFFIAVTFGVLFAGVYMAALVALIDRVRFIQEFILGLIK